MIRVSEFQKQYKNHLVCVPDMCLKAEKTLITGENGTGKSTLLKAMASFIGYDGDIELDSKPVYASEYCRFPIGVTVLEFLTVMNLSIIDVDKHLSDLNLMDKQDELIQNLSKGMMAKLRLITALNSSKDIVLLDEPLSGIDVTSVPLVRKMIRSSDKKLVIVSHLADELRDVVDEVIQFD